MKVDMATTACSVVKVAWRVGRGGACGGVRGRAVTPFPAYYEAGEHCKLSSGVHGSPFRQPPMYFLSSVDDGYYCPPGLVQ